MQHCPGTTNHHAAANFVHHDTTLVPLQTAGQCLRRNFLAMLDSTCDVDAHALAARDTHNADMLRRLTHAAQSLLLRLLLRRGPWFRVRSLVYEDVTDVDATVAELVAAGLLTSATPASTPQATPHSQQSQSGQGA